MRLPKNFAELRTQSSMLYWYAKIGNKIPTPKTEILSLPPEDLFGYVVGEVDLEKKYGVLIRQVAKRVGYPLFLRTDQASGKHEWMDTCFVLSEDELFKHIYNVLEFNETADVLGLPYKALVFREYVPLYSKFKAFKGMPVAKEFRVFVKDGNVLCVHFYWVPEAIKQGYHQVGLPENWVELLQELNSLSDEDVNTLFSYAKTFSRLIPGYWSVDFAYTQDGKWILIDAARGELSWHPKCKIKEELLRKNDSV